MARTAQQLLEEALELPSEQRGELVLNLLESLGPESSSSASDQHEKWLVEIEQRADRALAGEPGLSWEEALVLVERRLGRDR